VASPDALKALLEALQAEQARRRKAQSGGYDDPREWLMAELRAIAERLAATEGPLLDDASIAQRLAVLTYLPHRLSAAEQEAESAALDAWFEERYGAQPNTTGTTRKPSGVAQ
jgi:hypothetical protein